MLGEQLTAADVTARGITGDRALALHDTATGRIASAKHPAGGSGCSPSPPPPTTPASASPAPAWTPTAPTPP
ncbi:hypothetical protein ACFQY4_23245 [Catellatospora bangladeshensis]|uniref:hypothetical protein n=1 Tax=Catellatospora bangladeshensis TaxID=310355 RepID=UPI003617F849